MIQPYFTEDTYTTPADRKESIWNKLLFRTRLPFYTAIAFKSIFPSAKLANKGVYDDQEWVKSSKATLDVIEAHKGRFDIRGLENITKVDGPVVFVSNHMSTLETFIFPCLVRPHKPVTFVVKEKLIKGNLFGSVMRSRDPITVTRKDPRADLDAVINGGKERLAKGTSIIIFPQSTKTARWRYFEPKLFNSLGVKLAKMAGVPVIPIAIKTNFWGDSPIFRGFGKVDRKATIHMEFGEPMTIEGRGKAEHQRCVDFIKERTDRWEAECAKK